MATAKNNRHQNDSGNQRRATRKGNAEPARKAPDTKRGLTHSPYFNGALYERMSQDLHLGGMSKRTHEGYLSLRRLWCPMVCDHARALSEVSPVAMANRETCGQAAVARSQTGHNGLRVGSVAVSLRRDEARQWHLSNCLPMTVLKELPPSGC